MLQAFPLLKKAAESDPDDLEVQLKLGQTYLAASGIKEAREAALHILDKQPGDEQALVLLAETAVSPDDLEAVRTLIEARRAKDQDRPAYHLALGDLAWKAKNLDIAENEFQSVIKSDPKSATAHIGLGTLYWARNDLKSAGQEFKTAADLSPPRSVMRLRYVDFLMKTGASAEAKNILEDITRKAPDYLPVRAELMKMACAEHRDDDCVARVQNILAQDPLNHDALFEDGILSAAKGELAKSIREFEYLSDTYSQNPLVRYQLALAYLLQAKAAETGERDKSIENAENRLTEAVKLAPQFRAGGHAPRRTQDPERYPGCRRGLTDATNQRTAADYASTLYACVGLSRSATGGSSASSLSANGGIVSERSATSISPRNGTAHATPAGGSSQGV